jgi:hypothetical protein
VKLRIFILKFSSNMRGNVSRRLLKTNPLVMKIFLLEISIKIFKKKDEKKLMEKLHDNVTICVNS